MAGIRTNQLDEQDFRQTYVTREEITQETFNDEEPLESKKANLEAKYNETISNLKDSIVTAILQDDSQTQSELKQEYIQVVNDYENQLKDLEENK